MAFVVDNSGNITCYQGDSGTLTVNGLPTDKDYSVYFAVQDEKRNKIGSEIVVNSNYSSTISFVFLPAITDNWQVNKNDEYTTYYYGIKICDGENLEDTLFIGGLDFGDNNTINVYPKKVEGVI